MRFHRLVLLLLLPVACVACASHTTPEGLRVQDASASSSAGSADGNARITVRIENLRNSDGVVGLSLFAQAEGFPDAWDTAFANATLDIVDGQVEYVFEGVPPGTYAVSALHDENANGAMDTNAFGMPQEGYGASRNPDARFSAPDFEEAKFDIDGADTETDIALIYW